ncbi:hypothetical protein CEXT_175091 [Caerostris extrusa]|uniref:Ycf15 n=1 Tax=Caerostris extrusa TaxID=172846 RepID=A0AAV4SZ81_CAEEX|nr:hypothetical protein CEXT_175091 [Caerostris extrusa]
MRIQSLRWKLERENMETVVVVVLVYMTQLAVSRAEVFPRRKRWIGRHKDTSIVFPELSDKIISCSFPRTDVDPLFH